MYAVARITHLVVFSKFELNQDDKGSRFRWASGQPGVILLRFPAAARLTLAASITKLVRRLGPEPAGLDCGLAVYCQRGIRICFLQSEHETSVRGKGDQVDTGFDSDSTAPWL
jgi:hypothetical protein